MNLRQQTLATPLSSGAKTFWSASRIAVFAATLAVIAGLFFRADVTLDILWFILIAVAATYVLLRTPVGNWIFASGGDANAASNSGVPVKKVKLGLFMLTACTEFGKVCHLVDLLSHLVESRINPVSFGLDILGDNMFNLDAWLMEYSMATCLALDQL